MRIFRTIQLTFCCVLSAILIAGCDNKKNSGQDTVGVEFPDSVDVTWKYLAGDGYVPDAMDMVASDSLVYVLGINHGHWIHIFDTRTGAYQGMRVARGEDEGQLENASTLNRDILSGKFSMQDFPFGKISSIVEFSAEFKPEREYSLDSVFRITHGVYDLFNGKTLVLNPIYDVNNRWTSLDAFTLIDSSTHEKFYSFIGKETIDSLKASIYRVLAVSPSKSSVASVMSQGGALEIYRISRDSIYRTFVRNYFPVDYIYSEGREFPEINRDIQYGFRWVTSTDDYIYASYCDSKEVQPLVTTIGVWDWDGNPVKKIKTDRNIWNMATSPDGKRLYCISPVAGTSPQLCYIDL